VLGLSPPPLHLHLDHPDNSACRACVGYLTASGRASVCALCTEYFCPECTPDVGMLPCSCWEPCSTVVCWECYAARKPVERCLYCGDTGEFM
jgi:hypothetical protein